MIDVKRSDIGRTVLYLGRDGYCQRAVITGFNDFVVYIRYAGELGSKATTRQSLRWEHDEKSGA